MSCLKALLLSDGRPGHFRLAEGILAAVARKRSVETQRLEVSRRAFVPARVVSHMLNGGVPPARLLWLCYGIDFHDLPASDLIVSAGGNTLGANIACARLLKANNIFYGSLRRFRAEHFSLVLTSYSQQVLAPNQLMTLKPSATDPDLFLEDRKLGKIERSLKNGFKVAGLILGGNSGTVRYSQADWQRLLAFLDVCHARWGTRWIVSNSPRTPGVVSEQIAKQIAGGETLAIKSFIDVRRPGADNLSTLFSQCEVVVCCADSSTMLSECIWARKPVIAVCPDKFALPENELGYRRWLSDQRFTQEILVRDLEPEGFSRAIAGLRPLQENPLDWLSNELTQRLPSLMS